MDTNKYLKILDKEIKTMTNNSIEGALAATENTWEQIELKSKS